jgi:hypothetical protein
VVRRDDVDHVALEVVEVAGGGVGLGVELDHLAAGGARHPFDHAGVVHLPGLLEQAFLEKESLASAISTLDFIMPWCLK